MNIPIVTTEFEGYLDCVAQGTVHGWVWRPREPSKSLTVELIVGDRVIARSEANLFRSDLVSVERGTGRYGFAILLPTTLNDGNEHFVSVRVAGSNFVLTGSPLTYRMPSPALTDILPQPFLPASRIRGQVDCLDEELLVGWALDPTRPETPVRLELYDDVRFVVAFTAATMRPDLRQLGIGTGHHGFALFLPASVLDGREHLLNLRDAQSQSDLLAHPLPFTASPADVVLSSGQSTLPRPCPGHRHSLGTDDVAQAQRLQSTRLVAKTAGAAPSGPREISRTLPPKEPPVVAETRPSGATSATGEKRQPQEKPEPSAKLVPLGFKGHLEPLKGGLMRGWVWARRQPDRRLSVEILADDHLVATVRANMHREDLERNGTGDGRYGFEFHLPAALHDGQPHLIAVRVAGEDYELINGRQTFQSTSQSRAEQQAASTGKRQEKDDGLVACPGYLDDRHARHLIASLPLEHQMSSLMRISQKRRQLRLVNRLKRERLAFLRDRAATGLVIPVDAGEQSAALETLEIWTQQSHPAVRTVFLIADDAVRQAMEAKVAGSDSVQFISVTDSQAWSSFCSEMAAIAFARPGDILHPSLAATLRRLRPQSDILIWNLFQPDTEDGSSGKLYRRPRFDIMTASQATFVDTTFAVRGTLAASCPPALLVALGRGNPHALLFWLATQPDVSWHTHPEALTIRRRPVAPLSRDSLASDSELYSEIGEALAEEFALEESAADLPVPFVLLPVRRAKRISVIICYRDHADRTLRCLNSLVRQRITGSIEIVLVDNQSEPAVAAQIPKAARRLFGDAAVVVETYDAPFNHSAQNNLGVAAASGDVVVICNNDIVLRDDTVLEELAAWALRPGMGTVGCQIADTAGGRGSYGHVVRPLTDDPFLPAFAENTDATYGNLVHSVPGNSLCFAAIARERYLELGGLDEVRFPIGYNDVEFALRCRQSGLSHLYLGHLRVEHARGSSRTGDNEDLQSLWIREMYPLLSSERLVQLQCERIDPLDVRFVAPEIHQVASQKIDAAVDSAMNARHTDEVRRARIAEALVDISKIVDSLNTSVERLKSTAVTD